MKVARMQGRCMHTHQRDRVRAVVVNGYHRVPLTIVLIADGSRQRAGESDDVLARIKVIDRDRADLTRRRLVEHKAILTRADRYRVTISDINGVVAVADGYRVILGDS